MSDKSYEALVAEHKSKLLTAEERKALWEQQAKQMAEELSEDLEGVRLVYVNDLWALVSAWVLANNAFVGSETVFIPPLSEPIVLFEVGSFELGIWVSETQVCIAPLLQ